MRVEGLDHINIVTDRLDETAQFYADVLDFERRDGPPPLSPEKVQWMCDATGRPIIHINAVDLSRSYDRAFTPGAATGALHHIAMRMSGYEEAKARLEAGGMDFRLNLVEGLGLRQILLADPNNVLLELNFPAE